MNSIKETEIKDQRERFQNALVEENYFLAERLALGIRDGGWQDLGQMLLHSLAMAKNHQHAVCSGEKVVYLDDYDTRTGEHKQIEVPCECVLAGEPEDEEDGLETLREENKTLCTHAN